jgi:hypothetical protein
VLADLLSSGSAVETDPRESLEMLRRARAIAQELVDKHPGVLRYLELLGGSQMAIGNHLSEKFGREAEAIVAGKNAVPIIQRLAEAQHENYYFQDLLGRT